MSQKALYLSTIYGGAIKKSFNLMRQNMQARIFAKMPSWRGENEIS